MDLAPGAFTIINLVFRNEIVMGFSRVTDPKATGTKENLTLSQLLHVFEKHCTDMELLQEFQEREDHIRTECEPFRIIRNRSLAHLDLQTLLGSHPKPLPNLDTEMVHRCLDLLAEFMNDILGHFTTIYCDFVPHFGLAPSNIIYALNKYQEWYPIIEEIERRKIMGE